MRLSWNEVRARAAAFADEWQDAAYEKGGTQSFYNAFFQVFGVQRRSVARYEEHVAKLDNRSGFIDLFWPGVLIVEQKSAGRDLKAAYEQAGEYFDALPERDRPRAPDLRRTHQALDRAVDRLYRRAGFASERERVEHLFMLYEKVRAPLESTIKRSRRRGCTSGL